MIVISAGGNEATGAREHTKNEQLTTASEKRTETQRRHSFLSFDFFLRSFMMDPGRESVRFLMDSSWPSRVAKFSIERNCRPNQKTVRIGKMLPNP